VSLIGSRNCETMKVKWGNCVKLLLFSALIELTNPLLRCAECVHFANNLSPSAEAQEAANSQPVRITIQPQDLIALEGESFELNCDAEGDPKPSIEWYHDGHLISSFSQSRTTMGGSIQFLDIRPNGAQASGGHPARPKPKQSDAGVYHCLARNQFGEARSRNATLQVACKYPSFYLSPFSPFGETNQT